MDTERKRDAFQRDSGMGATISPQKIMVVGFGRSRLGWGGAYASEFCWHLQTVAGCASLASASERSDDDRIRTYGCHVRSRGRAADPRKPAVAPRCQEWYRGYHCYIGSRRRAWWAKRTHCGRLDDRSNRTVASPSRHWREDVGARGVSTTRREQVEGEGRQWASAPEALGHALHGAREPERKCRRKLNRRHYFKLGLTEMEALHARSSGGERGHVRARYERDTVFG
ncbi:hypothetical protein C8Q79DRAFT_737279 [Trametes meyenii]|nr:hypothetical protein C8Q79DRAFT_737279 [Trametes meyenii]